MNPLDYITTANYPTSFLENTFGNKYYKSVIEPAKSAIKSGSTTAKPPLGQLIKNWNPLKAFTPQMLATGPTKAASTLLKSSGIGTLASLLFSPTHLGADDMPTGDAAQQYFDYYNKYGDNYGDLKIPGSNWRQKLMNQKIQQQKKMIGMPQHLTRTPPTPSPSGGGQWVGGSPAYTHQGQGGGEFIDTQGNVDYHDPYDPGGGEAQGGFIDGTNRRRSYFDGGLLSLWPR